MSKVTDLVDGNFEAFRQGITADLYTKLSERLNLERQEISQGLYKNEIDEGIASAIGGAAGTVVGKVKKGIADVKKSYKNAEETASAPKLKKSSTFHKDHPDHGSTSGLHTLTDKDYE